MITIPSSKHTSPQSPTRILLSPHLILSFSLTKSRERNMTRKCQKIEQINSVMEMARVGMISGAGAALAVGAATSSVTTRKRRKRNSGEHLKFTAGSSFVQHDKSRSPVSSQPETTPLDPSESEARCSSLHTDEFPDFCCSSNGSTERDDERIGFLDLEVESAQVETSMFNCSDDERRDMSLTSDLRPRSEDMESAEKPKEELITEANCQSKSTGKKRPPTELELEEFFGAAEKEIQNRFVEKYNYDIVNDAPLEGRYEWVKLKP